MHENTSQSPFVSLNSSHTLFTQCFMYSTGNHIVAAFTAFNVLFISPLFLAVLNQWRKWRSLNSVPRMRQSDLFSCNMAAMGLIEIFSSILYSLGGYTAVIGVAMFGFNMFSVTWSVKLQFHSLTCVERYLAVVHPITYLRQRSRAGRRLRNANLACVWLLFLVLAVTVHAANVTANLTMFFFLTNWTFMVVCFCSISVLGALKRPGPGEPGGVRDHANQAKRRAFLTILLILVAVLFGLVWTVVLIALIVVAQMPESESCLLFSLIPWFCLPSSVVLPVLFLHRTGNLPQCVRKRQPLDQGSHV
ncbi:hypothetical protein FQA47_005969 [Oryzias melastigma]|uniref:G-protein coupled receptors family 1 profile domain-containing protein n=1 Tax=Oryzias melastigma TaxID=30732 RepID=A0A834BQD9_ORYME|nr:hypothetical protein FQA47_005969 [Oryzias melastigma]